MNDLSLQFSVMAHLRPVTEVEVVRQVDAWVLAIGSGAWDSPSGGRVTLFAERRGAAAHRGRDHGVPGRGRPQRD